MPAEYLTKSLRYLGQFSTYATLLDIHLRLLQGQEDAQVASESELVASLSLLPQPLIFSRLTHSSSGSHGAKELFGSVSVGDVLAELKDFGIRLEENQCSFIEEEGIQNGRVKSLGKFACESPRWTDFSGDR